MTEDIKVTPSEDPLPRKDYASPQLVTYGNISVITQAIMGGKLDDVGGKGANNKT